MSGTVLNTSEHTRVHVVNLWGVKYYDSHFTDDETEVYNKSEVICPRS